MKAAGMESDLKAKAHKKHTETINKIHETHRETFEKIAEEEKQEVDSSGTVSEEASKLENRFGLNIEKEP